MNLVALVMVLLLGACGPLPRLGEPLWNEAGPIIDRFSPAAGRLMTRAVMEGLPGPGQPIELDRPPFITQGLGPDGVPVRYYNFDVQSPSPSPRYALTHELGSERRVRLPGQLDLVDVIPGQPGYSDFWQIIWVQVPEGFRPGSILDVRALLAAGYPMEASSNVVNCPVVPAGSKARQRRHRESPDPEPLAYRGAQIFCMTFEDSLFLDGETLPTSPIYVTFRRDPDQQGGGPSTGFRQEPGTQQTHNVVFSLPGDNDYSPLWDVHIYGNREFDSVRDANSASQARLIAKGPLVNCPIAVSPPDADL